MGITTTIPTNLDFPNRGILERDAFVLAQETAQDLLAGSYTTSLNQYATELNLTQADINLKWEQVQSQAVTGGYSQAYIDANFAPKILNTGFKNYIINGKKVINQRGLASTDNSYNQDRWYKAGTNWYQGIEGDNNLISGKKYTLNWVGNATASYYVGTATSSTINAQSFTTIENGDNFTLSISAGQNLWIKFASDSTGSTFNFVQLEEGTIATPFEHRPIGLELSLCKRYHEVVDGNIGGYGTAGQQIFATKPFTQSKRVLPSMGLLTLNGNNVDIVAANPAASTLQYGIYNIFIVGTGAGNFVYEAYASAEL